MTDNRLFRIKDGKVREIRKRSLKLEKEIQSLTENNLTEIFGIRFLASEYSTGEKHRGRIDSLGIDENNTPVIIEYKKYKSENIINQGLYYMNWLIDHKANFEMLVLDKFGKRIDIDWSSPRILCIAEDFTKYDLHAIEQMSKNIELIKFQKYEESDIVFELVKSVEQEVTTTLSKGDHKTIDHAFEDAHEDLKELISVLEDYVMSLGDDIQKKELKFYWAYKRLRNFASLLIYRNKLRLYLNLNPSEQKNLPSFTRDVTDIGHQGIGDLEIDIKDFEDLEIIKPLIEKSFKES